MVDATNPAFGERFTVIANHFKSKGCPGTGADADQNDGQGCFNATRTAQANRLLTWINSTVLPAAGDPDGGQPGWDSWPAGTERIRPR